MSDILDMDSESLQKLADTIAKLNLRVRGSIWTANADYEIETFYDEVIIEDSEGNEVVRAEVETQDA